MRASSRLPVGFDRAPQTPADRRYGHAGARMLLSVAARLRSSLHLAGLLRAGRDRPRLKERPMSAQAPPTERQLRYLRSLASRTATTFATPPTRSQASREIDRLRRLQAAPRERFAHDLSAYATTLHEDEVSGFGATRSWRSRPPGRSAPPKSAGSESRVLARYALSSGQRLIEGIATGQGLTLRDLPASGDGRCLHGGEHRLRAARARASRAAGRLPAAGPRAGLRPDVPRGTADALRRSLRCLARGS